MCITPKIQIEKLTELKKQLISTDPKYLVETSVYTTIKDICRDDKNDDLFIEHIYPLQIDIESTLHEYYLKLIDKLILTIKREVKE